MATHDAPRFRNHPTHAEQPDPDTRTIKCPVCGSDDIAVWDMDFKYIYDAYDDTYYDIYRILPNSWYRCLGCNLRKRHSRDTVFDDRGNVFCVDSSFQLKLIHMAGV